MPPKTEKKPDEILDGADEEPDDEPELEVVDEIEVVKLTKSGRPRKQMSDEVKARNTANLVLARAKAAALKRAQTSLTDKEKAIEKEKKDAEKKAKNKIKEDLKAAQDDTIAAYEQEKREKKIKDLKEEVKPKAVKKKKKTIIIEESDTEDEEEEEVVVKRVRKKKAPPPAPPAPPPAAPLDIVTPVVPVPVPKVYTDEEVAKLKQQKILFEKEQKKRAILMNAIFN